MSVTIESPTLTAKQFKDWRIKNKFSIEEAANLFGYANASAIYQIESGSRSVPKRIALQMHILRMQENK